MALIQVTAGQLKREAENLQKLNEEYKSQVTSLEVMEEELCFMWEGEAKQAFHSAFCSDKGQMENFYQAMGRYAAALLTIAAQYETAENTNLETARARTYQ